MNTNFEMLILHDLGVGEKMFERFVCQRNAHTHINNKKIIYV